jgi:hypothetical protein
MEARERARPRLALAAIRPGAAAAGGTAGAVSSALAQMSAGGRARQCRPCAVAGASQAWNEPS